MLPSRKASATLLYARGLRAVHLEFAAQALEDQDASGAWTTFMGEPSLFPGRASQNRSPIFCLTFKLGRGQSAGD